MAKKSKTEELTDLLKDLEATTPDIEASAVVSVDGLMIASALPQDVEEVGNFQAMMEWITGHYHEVEEIECRAMGHPADVIKIWKTRKEE